MWQLLHQRFDVLHEHIEQLQHDPRLDRAVQGSETSLEAINLLRSRVDELERSLIQRLDVVELDVLERMRRGIGRLERDAQTRGRGFQVFSQDDEDAILASLAEVVPKDLRTFAEFGVEDYSEANTRFLVMDGGWGGLILDADEKCVRRIQSSPWYWRYPVFARHAWITRENVNAILTQFSVTGEIGLLSIDIDGNDLWVWDAVTAVAPVIVAIEYNWRFGPTRSVAVPYDPEFDRSTAHPSQLYFGASLKAIEDCGHRKGYDLVAVSSSSVNAFFVRSDRRPPSIPKLTAEDLWAPGRYTEFRDSSGHLQKLPPAEQVALIESLPVALIDDGTNRSSQSPG